MRNRLIKIINAGIIVFSFALFSASIVPSSGAAGLVITEGRAIQPEDVSDRRAFPSTSSRISAYLIFQASDKLRVSFSWYGPDGGLRSKIVKMAFPAKGPDILSSISDDIDCSGETGWWRVEVNTDKETLTESFLITGDEAALAVGTGGRAERLTTLSAIGQSTRGYEDALRLAAWDADPDVRAAGVAAASRIGGEFSLRYVESAAADTSEAVRAAVAKAASGLEVAPALMKELSTDQSAFVRRTVAQYLGATFGKGAAPLLGVLVADKDLTVREAALDALSTLEGQAAVTALSNGLSVSDQDFRMKVLEALVGRREPGRVDVISDLLSDGSPEIRHMAFRALLQATQWPAEKAMPLLDDPDESIALEAYALLREKSDEDFSILAIKSRHRSVRLEAVEDLASRGKDGLDGLVGALQDVDSVLRIKAAEAIVSMHAVSAKDAMSKAFEDGNAEVRRLSVAYFAKIGGPESYGVLGEAAYDKSSEVRKEGLGSLLADRDASSSKALASYYRTGGTSDRYAIAEELGKRDDRFAVDLLKDALGDKESGIRLISLKTLAYKGYSADVAPLALDTDLDVRRAALGAMISAPEPAMVDILARALTDPNPGARIMALDALAEIDGPEAGNAVSSAVNDRSAEVRTVARKVLFERNDEGAAAGLASLLEDPDGSVRRKAAQALKVLKGDGVDEKVFGELTKGGASARALVLEILGRRASPMLEDAITQGLSDSDSSVRSAAMDTTDSLDVDSRKRISMSMLASTYPEVRLRGVRVLDRLKDEAVEMALAQLLSDDDAAVRLAALQSLAKTGSSEIYKHLSVLVTDKNRDVAVTALEAADTATDPTYRTGILIRAALAGNEAVVKRAADLLADSPAPGALPVYEKFFKAGYNRDSMLKAAAAVPGDDSSAYIGEMYRLSSRDKALRLAAVKGLSGRGEAALDILKEALDDPAVEVRREAVVSISHLEDSPAKIDALGRALTENQPAVRSAAFEALSGIEDRREHVIMLKALNYPELIDKAFSMVDRSGPDLLPAFAGSAGVVGEPAVRAKLVVRLADRGLETGLVSGFLEDPSRDVRMAAVRVLAGRGGQEAAYGLLRAGGDRDTKLQEEALEALSAMEPAVIEAALEEHFLKGTAGPGLLNIAARAVHDAGILERLVARLEADDGVRLDTVLEPIIARREPSDVPALLEGLKNRNVLLQREIIRALASLEPGTSGDALGRAVKRYPELGGMVVRVAFLAENPMSVIMAALENGDEKTRSGALDGLKDIPCDMAEKALVLGAGDPDEGVRLTAVKVAAASGCEAPLVKAASDSSPAVRSAAATGLLRLGGDTAVDTLSVLALDKDETVSQSATGSLSALDDEVPDSLWVSLTLPAVPKNTRITALKTLSARKTYSHSRVFVEALRDGDREIADCGVSGLIGLGPAVRDTVRDLFKDYKTRPYAIKIAADTGEQSYEANILTLLPALQGEELLAAVAALGRLGGAASLGPLGDAYKRGDTRLKVAVLKSFEGLEVKGSERELTDILTVAVSDEDEAVRFYSARAAGSLKVYSLMDTLNSRMNVETSSIVLRELERSIAELNMTPAGRVDSFPPG